MNKKIMEQVQELVAFGKSTPSSPRIATPRTGFLMI
jgi:hypothetical protein